MWFRVVKRAIDVAGSAALLVLSAPLMLCTAAAIHLTMGRPVLFCQERAGYRGRTFLLYKFRTMRQAYDPGGEPLADGERLTRLGRLLRRLSLDELPQLWNVLAGTMSLVGPRPLLVRYLDRYTPEQARRHDVKPGLTGWAQVHGRNALGWDEKFRLDVWYADHASLRLDAWILAKTVWKVFRREGVSHAGSETMPEFLGTRAGAPAATLRDVNVLFTSAGRRVELVRSFRAAYRKVGIAGRIVAVDVDPLATALRLADRSYLVPRLDSPQYVPALAEILRRERVDVVFPLIDPDVPVLAAHRQTLEATGARLAVVSPEAAAICADKWRTHQFLRDLGLPTAEAWLPGQLEAVRPEYPLFIKPRFGSASQHTFKVNDRRQLTFFSTYVPQPIIEEFLPGPEITNDVVCDLEGNVLAVVSQERIRVRSGEVLVGKTIHDPVITEGCLRIAEALPAVGPITVQCMMSGSAPRFTEINARVGGGVPLAIAAGADWPAWLLARWAGAAVDVPPLGSYHGGLYLSRFDDSLFLTEAEREQMESCHL